MMLEAGRTATALSAPSRSPQRTHQGIALAKPRPWTCSPAEFIPIAEESGLIVPIGEVLCTACAQNQVWQADGLPR